MKQELTHPEDLHCANCGTPLQGEFCHACGQSVHSMLKPVHGMLEDTLDLVLNVDGRVVHTLPPLFTRPGFLTLEYFAGRRTRYLTPFRLMFTLCLLAFFVTQMAFDSLHVPLAGPNDDAFTRARTPAEVQHLLKRSLADLDQAENAPDVPALAKTAMESGKLELRRKAQQRLLQLGVKPDAGGIATAAPSAAVDDAAYRGWAAQPTHIAIAWLPDFANASLTRSVARFKANLLAMRVGGETREQAARHMISGMFSVLPQTMFVLIPLFALLLKVLYLFRRRLYMEHLIVAMHSHAFLFLCLLLGTLLQWLTGWATLHIAWLAIPLKWLIAGLWLWVPTYLLIMQKRVYRQGWPMTVLKYLFVGWCYLWMLLIAVAGAAVLGLAA